MYTNEEDLDIGVACKIWPLGNCLDSVLLNLYAFKCYNQDNLTDFLCLEFAL